MDNTKPKQGVGAQDSTSTGTYDPGVLQMTDEEYESQLNASEDQETEPLHQDPAHPVRSFFYKLIHGAPGKESVGARAKEAGRSILRGGIDLEHNLARTEQAVGGHLQQSDNVFTQAVGTAFSKAGRALEISPETEDRLLGKRSDDPVASFAETVTTFGLGFAATGGLGAAASEGVGYLGASRLLQLTAAGATRGAAVDFAGMDPDEMGLAELLAKAPVRGVNDLGALLSVKDGDGEILKRIKRAGAGLIPGVVMEAIGARLAIRSAMKTLANPEAGVAAQKAAVETLGHNSEILQKIQEGTHVTPGAHVTVTPTEHGLWEVRPVNLDATDAEITRMGTAAEVEGMGIAREVDPNRASLPEVSWTPEDEARFSTLLDSETLTPVQEQELEVLQQKMLLAERQGWTGATLAEKEGIKAGKPGYAAEPFTNAVGQDMGAAYVYRNAEGKPVGTLIVEALNDDVPNAAMRDRKTNIVSIAVDPAYRRQGIATRLYQMAEEAGHDLNNGDFGRSFTPQSAAVLRKAGKLPEGASVLGQADEPLTVLKEGADHAASLGSPLPPQPLQYASRGEAEAQAETINRAINERITGARQSQGGLTREQGDLIREWTHKLTTSTDPADLQRLIDGTHFNLTYYTEAPTRVKALIESISEVMKSALDEHGGIKRVAIAQSFRRARRLINGGDVEELAPALTEALKNPEGITHRHVTALAADLVMRDFGRKVGEMFDVLEARPHDVVAHEEAALALNNFYELQRTLAAHNSEVGRSLNILKYRDVFQRWYGRLTDRAAKAAGKETDEAVVKEGAEAAAKDGAKALEPAQKTAAEPNRMRRPKPDVDAAGVEKSAEGPSLDHPDFQLAEGDHIVNPDEIHGAGEGPDVLDGQKIKKGSTEDPVKNAPPAPPQYTAGMSHRELRTVVRMFKMAEGKPRLYVDVAKATQIVQETGSLQKGVEFFVNSLLSGFITPVVQLTSGVGIANFEAAAKVLAGFRESSPALVREGMDQWYSYFHYFRENIQGGVESFKVGRSIINPTTQHFAIGGNTGRLVRMPSRAIMATDEFIRVAAYRAELRAKSLRWWRDPANGGLDGTALLDAVERDVKAGFDEKTGIATIPQVLDKAEIPTLSGRLEGGTIGHALLMATNEAPLLKFIMPFVKASANIMDFVWETTPGLNRANAEVREVLKAGGEEAAILRARTQMATTIYGASAALSLGGIITGNGPADPAVRREWLKNHKPRTLTIGGETFDYSRIEPFGTYLGLVADAIDLIKYGAPEHGRDLSMAIGAAITHNLSSKTYTKSLYDFMQAVTSGNPATFQQWVANLGTAFTTPRVIQQFNSDPYYREVVSLKDALFAKVPGLSQTLPVRYDSYGEAVLRDPSGPVMLNRVLNPVKDRGAEPHSVVAQAMQDLRQSFGPAPRRLLGGAIDLADSQWGRNAKDQTPWDRFNEVIREGRHGEGGFETRLQRLIETGKWERMGAGSDLAPGGERWIRAQAELERSREQALTTVFHEWRGLKKAYDDVQNAKGASIKGGDAAAIRALQGYRPANQ